MTNTFPSINPTYGVQKRSAPRTTELQFGDGYVSRANFGLNQNPKIYQLTYEVSESDNFNSTGISSADTIENFLDDRAKDTASFNFTPPGESTSSLFVCRQWTKSIPYLNRARIQVTFEEVFQS
jgi:phage-related protein